MAGTDAGQAAGVDFEEYARARQNTLVRAAFLVCGDEQLAKDRLRAAMLALASHWDRARHEQPDLFVRRTLYRDVLRASPSRPPQLSSRPVEEEPVDGWDAATWRRLEAALSEPVWDAPDESWATEEARRRRTTLGALDRLTPRQRALVTLLFFDDRGEQQAADVIGTSVAAVRAEARDAITELRAALPAGWLDDAPTQITRDVKDLLRLASDNLPAVDLTDGLWDEAHRQHRTIVRRTVLGVGSLAAAGVTATFLLREAPPGPAPTPTGGATTTTSTAAVTRGRTAAPGGRLASVEVNGLSVFLAPDPLAEGQLPRYPDADPLWISGRIGPPAPSTWAVFGEDGLAGVAEPIRAVFFVDAGRDDSPVLFVPGAPVPYVLGPAVRSGGQYELHPRIIADDRHRIVYLTRSGVAVLDARDASLTEVGVPGIVQMAGWARDGATIIAQGKYGENWVVDPRAGSARSVPGPRYADWADLAAGEAAALLRTFSATGKMTGSTALLGPQVVPNSPSVCNRQRWVAASVVLAEDYQPVAQARQGLVAVHAGPRPTPRVLAATGSTLELDRRFRPIGWASPSVVLVESSSQLPPNLEATLRNLLAWDVLAGRLWLVAAVVRVFGGEGEFVGDYAV